MRPARERSPITERYPAQIFVPLIDSLAVFVSGVIAHYLRFGTLDVHERFVTGMILISIFIVMANFMDGAYVRWRTTRLSTILFRLVGVWLIVTLIATSITNGFESKRTSFIM